MIDFQYAEATYSAHQETINLMKLGDNYRYGSRSPTDTAKAFSLYDEAEGILNSFEGRCSGLSPYVYMRLCECYLYGIGTKASLLKAFDSLIRFKHYLRHLPFVAKVHNAEIDPNCQEMDSLADALLSDINSKFNIYGFNVYLGNNSLQVFSKFRVPFQINRDTQPNCVLLKTVIQRTLVFFPMVFAGTVFHGRYGTTDTKKSFYDLENVLFYNLNLAAEETAKYHKNICFSKIAQEELAQIQHCKNIPAEFCHCYEYFADSAPYASREKQVLIAQWEDLPFSPVKSTMRVSDYWIAMKRISERINIFGSVNTSRKEQFSLHLKIEKPKNIELKVLSVIKPLLDAIISALHGGGFSEEEVQLFAEKLGVPENWIENGSTNILGNRQYIQCYPSKNGIKWNPADDLCSKVSISVANGDSWKLSGWIYKMDDNATESVV